jgi:hypothetical protein
MQALAAALLLHAACASSQPPAQRPPLDPMSIEPGECDPLEYFFAEPGTSAQSVLRIALAPSGRAADVSLVSSSGDDDRDRLAVDIARHAFRCRHRLSANAPRVLDHYAVTFRSDQTVERPAIDNQACAKEVRYPNDGLYEGLEASGRFLVALDESGRVLRAWLSVTPDRYGFADASIDALEKRCRFTGARLDGRGVPFVLIYKMIFQLPR